MCLKKNTRVVFVCALRCVGKMNGKSKTVSNSPTFFDRVGPTGGFNGRPLAGRRSWSDLFAASLHQSW